MHVPLIFLPSKPTPSQQVEDPAKSLPHPDEAAALLILGLGGYGVTAGPWNSSEPSRSWSMELHNFYGFLTPGGYSCSFSPSFKSNGEHRDWEGGKFPNKQTPREGLSQARQWKEPVSKVPCKRGCYPPHPIGTRTWPQGSWECRARRVGLLHPQPVFQPRLV